jgi:hypothetical protein
MIQRQKPGLRRLTAQISPETQGTWNANTQKLGTTETSNWLHKTKPRRDTCVRRGHKTPFFVLFNCYTKNILIANLMSWYNKHTYIQTCIFCWVHGAVWTCIFCWVHGAVCCSTLILSCTMHTHTMLHHAHPHHPTSCVWPMYLYNIVLFHPYSLSHNNWGQRNDF